MRSFKRILQVLAAFSLLVILPIPQDVLAQQHVVTPSDLQKAVARASQTREDNLAKVRSVFASEEGRKALASANISEAKLDKAISTLNDDELARIAVRADKAHQDFVAGKLSDRDLIIILLAVVALVLIIVAVR